MLNKGIKKIKKNEAREKFLKDKAFLWWWVKDVKKISDAAMLEGTLNYGDWDDVKSVFKILGLNKAASIFSLQIKKKRNNYRPKTLNYFKLYFQEYAPRNIRD
ncbi:hypothetical protein GW758_03025 [Candidatus Falkowbacteria bacterium]|nr:hypothetical protein [Candidatus Falkowbacteria bacterium]